MRLLTIYAIIAALAGAQFFPFPGPGRPGAGGGGGGAPAFVQTNGATFDPMGTSRAVTFSGSTVSGNMVVGIYSGGSTLTCTDNKGNTFATVNATGDGGQHCAAYNVTGGASHQVTFAVTPSDGNPGHLIVLEYSGIATSSAFDQSCGNFGFTTNISCTTGTTTAANSLVLGSMFISTLTPTAGSGYTLRRSQGTIHAEDKTVSSTGAQVVNFSHAEASAGITASTFKGN